MGQFSDLFDDQPTDQQARANLRFGIEAQPDDAARAASLAKRYDLPPGVVSTYRPDYETRAKFDDGVAAMNQAPKLRDWLAADAERAKVAHDDLENLSALEKVVRFAGDTGSALVSAVPKFNESAWGLARAGADLLPDVIGKPMADKFAEYGGQQRRVAERLLPQSDNVLGASWYSGMQSLGLNVLQLPLGFGGKMAPVLTSMGLTTGGQAYGEARDQGRGVGESLMFGGSQGVIEAGTEMIGLPALFRMIKPGRFGAKAIEYLWKEQLGEQMATHLQDLNEWAVLHPDKTLHDYLAERPDAALQTALATVFSGGGQVSIMKAAQMIANRVGAKHLQAYQAEQQAQALEALAGIAQQSRLAQRAPDAFEQFVHDATQGTPLQEVYLSAHMLAQSGLADKLAAVSPSVAEQLAPALETGGDVRIPVSEFAARIATQGYAQDLINELKTEPGGMTRGEAEAYRQSQDAALGEEIGLLAAEQSADLTREEQAKAIQMDIAAKLNAAGRFSPAVNHAYSQLPRAFFGTMAQRLGGTPADLYAEYQPHIVAQGVTGSPMLSQDARGGFIPAEYTQDGKPVIGIFRGANLSTFLHESGHYFLESYAHMAKDAPNLHGDMQTLLDWFGVKDLAAWHAMSLDAKRAHHEQFARGFETYLAEGQAPSLEMRSIFARFRAWLLNVYRRIQGLNVSLSPEVRAVMDRMLATDAQILDAQRARGLVPLFSTAQEAEAHGMNWKDYQALNHQATAEALGDMEARSVRDMTWAGRLREETIKRLNKDAAEKRKAMRREVEAEVQAEPVYAVQRFLKTGATSSASGETTQAEGAHRLAIRDLKAMYPDGSGVEWQKLGYGKYGMLAENGLAPDEVASLFGFTSGDAMVRQILSAPTLADEVEGRTDQRMLEQYGDLTTPAGIARAADEAIHSDVRTRFLATELAGLQKAVGGARVLAQMAKDYAARLIDRTRVGQLRPTQYAAAEVRAGKAAEAALRKGDEAEAIRQKRFQMINHATTRAAYEAQAEVEKAVAFFRSVAAGSADAVGKARNMDLVNAARAILAEYGVGMRGKNPRAYMEAVKNYDPELYAVLEPALAEAEASARPLEDLTVAELRGLRDNVESLWYLARRERQVEIDGQLVDREQITGELAARLDELGVPDKAPGEDHAVTDGEKKARYLMGVRAALRRVESWVNRIDGGKITGGFRRYLFTPISEAADAYRADAGTYLRRYRDLLRSIEPTLTRGRIEAPELGYTFGHSRGDAGKAELLHAILHTGNESNKRKLLLGRNWARETAEGVLDTSRWDAFVRRMIAEGKLTKADFDFAQGVWDLLEEIKPLAQKTHREVFGRYFDEVTAQPFSNEFGSYRGGYVPAITDTFEVQDAAVNAELDAINQGNAFMFPAANRGFTKARVEYNRPLALDLRLLPQHIDKALLFSHLEPRVRDVMRTLRARDLAGKLNRYDPVAYTDLLLPWLNRAAKQTVETPATGWGGKLADRFFRTARSRAGMAAMFANLTNALQQITGFSLTALQVKPAYLKAATWRYLRAPGEMAEQIAKLSPFMANRQTNEAMQMRQQIEALLVNPSAYEKAQAWTSKHAYFLQSAFQNVVDNVTWAAAYDQAHAEGLTEADAIRKANAAVRETQGSLSPEDISRFESGPAFVRMFTQFSGYFNTQANILGTEFAKVAQDMGLKKGAGRLFYVFLFGFLVPAWVSEAIVQGMRGGPDDDDGDGYLDEFLAFFFGAPARNAAAMVPVVGQGAMLVANSFNNKPYDDRMSTAPAVSMIENAAHAPQSVYKAIAEDGKASRAVRDTLTLVSLLTGVPVSALAKPLGYAADVDQGRVQPTGAADAVRGAVSGVASPESKR